MKKVRLFSFLMAMILCLSALGAEIVVEPFNENTSVTTTATGGGLFDVDTGTAQVSGEIQEISDEIDNLLGEVATAPAQAPARTTEYTVQAGDSLWKIAQRLLGDGNRYNEIVEANKDKYPSLLKNPDLIHAGWNLTVPVEGEDEDAASAPAGNSVQDNDGAAADDPPNQTVDDDSARPVGSVAQIPQWSVQERVKRFQKALDAANVALLAQDERIAALNERTIRFLIDNKFMTEEEWMGMNPPVGYVYRLDRLGKVELVGSDNKPLSNEDMARLDAQSPVAQDQQPAQDQAAAPAETTQPADTNAITDEELAAADQKAKQDAYNRLEAEKKAAEKAAADKKAAEKAAAEKKEADKKAAEEKAAAEKAEKEAEAKAATKYQSMIKAMGLPDFTGSKNDYLKAVSKGKSLMYEGIFKSNSFYKFSMPYDFPHLFIPQLQNDLKSAQAHYEKMVDKNKTSRVLGIFGDTIESAGKKVEAAKARLQKAVDEIKTSLNQAKVKALALQNQVKADTKKIDTLNKELGALDKYDSANSKKVQELTKQINDIKKKNKDANEKLADYEILKNTFKL